VIAVSQNIWILAYYKLSPGRFNDSKNYNIKGLFAKYATRK
jgi:hypothetical protein